MEIVGEDQFEDSIHSWEEEIGIREDFPWAIITEIPTPPSAEFDWKTVY
jgi:hypothetical protein